MKKTFITDILERKNGEAELLGWINRIHKLGKMIFINVADSTGNLQVVINRASVTEQLWNIANKLSL